MTWKIPLFKMYSDIEDIENVNKVLSRGSFWAEGPEIAQFEDKIAEYVGAKYCLVFNNGTSALHALLLACEFQQGNEVIVPSFTFISTANCSLFVGSKPIFAEIEKKTYGLDPESVKEKITPKTKAIMPIHYGGCPCLIKQLKEIADDYNLLLLEDAAESLGAKIGSEYVGTFGDASMFSFCQNKIISTGEGGAIITDSKDIFEKLKLIRSHGRSDTQNYFSSTSSVDYVTLGYNFRLPSINAALGISQLNKIEYLIQTRRSIAESFSQKLSNLENISIQEFPSDYLHVYQMYTIQVKNGFRDKLKEYLASKGIMSKVYFSPVHLTQFYKTRFGYKSGDLPVTEEISSEVLSLPIYPSLTTAEINYIATSIHDFFNEA